MPSAPTPEPARGARRAACPGCGQPAAKGFTPFCSQGCRDRDLIQWLSDGYRIAGSPAADDADFGTDGLDS